MGRSRRMKQREDPRTMKRVKTDLKQLLKSVKRVTKKELRQSR